MKKFSAVLQGVLVLTLLAILIPAVSAAPIAVSRVLPATATAGGSINVSLAVTLDPGAPINAAIIKDYVPSGWNVTSSDPTAGGFDKATGEIKWVLFGTSLATQTINYTVAIPSKEISGDKTFSGFVSYIDADENYTDDGGIRLIYVDDDNTGFEDGSKEHQWNTIQEAMNNASDDDIITVRDGSYSENVIVNKSVTIGSENGSTYTIVRAASSASPVVHLTKDHVNMSGFTLTGASDTATAGIWLNSTADYCNISNINASNNYNGIGLDTSNYNTLSHITVNSNSGYGIYLTTSSNNTITNINTSNNNESGIYLYSSSNNFIYNNYFNNANNAYDDGNNIWNITKTTGINIIEGSYVGGNYWSDYEGEDTDGDGIGDTLLPYNSSGQIMTGGDYLPLVHDKTPPIIIFFPPTPANNSEVKVDHVFIYVITNEPCTTARLNWNGANETIHGAEKYFYLNKTGLSRGVFTYKVYANDTYDNIGVSETRIVTVDVPLNVTIDGIVINGTEALSIPALQRVQIPTESAPIDTIFIRGAENSSEFGLSSVHIPTIKSPFSELFLECMESRASLNLTETTIPTEASPFDAIFIKEAETNATFELTCQIKPIAVFSLSPEEPFVGDSAIFNASESYSIGGYIAKYEWSFVIPRQLEKE